MSDYKAKSRFSFGGKVYEEGQAVDIQDEDTLKKLTAQGLIGTGKGTPAEDLEAKKQEELDAKLTANAEKRDQAARDEWNRVQEKAKNAGLPEAPKMKTKDETQAPAAKGKGK